MKILHLDKNHNSLINDLKKRVHERRGLQNVIGGYKINY